MGKIGIITFHRALNSGAVLQAYALQETLNEKYDTYIVDYRNDYIEEIYYSSNDDSPLVKRIIRNVLFHKHIQMRRRRKEKFIDFQKQYYRCQGTYNKDTIKKANDFFSRFIVGSDQVWNLSLSRNDWNYFLDFADDSKKYSYAVSFGGGYYSEDHIIKIKNYLQLFKSVLVREEYGKKLVASILEEDVALTVCDPVFFLKKNEWIERLSLSKSNKGKYILVYPIAATQYMEVFARKLSQETGYRIIYINNSGSRIKNRFFDIINDAGPIDFLEYILNASCVLTSSFHAVAFSIIFNVPFFYELNKENKNANFRIEDLINNIGIHDREIMDRCELNEIPIDWNRINNCIDKYSEKSKEILFHSLNI